jgi:acyl-Coa thioesterase superfamily protein/acyl-CoA thioesterase superfamily protein
VGDPYFRAISDEADTGTFLAAEHTAGPWNRSHQHGGPPNALAVRAAERCAAAATGRVDLRACRIASEFVGPVPVGEVTTAARVARGARSGVLVEVVIAGGGRGCLHSRVWLIAEADTASVASSGAAPVGPPTDRAPAFGLSFPYSDSIDWHEETGSILVPGPASVWARPRPELLSGEPWTGLQRVALLGDSASGISGELDWEEWTFLNVDLDVHIVRPVVGSWLHLSAVTTLGPNGSGVARATVSDIQGPVGFTLQTLVLAPRRR